MDINAVTSLASVRLALVVRLGSVDLYAETARIADSLSVSTQVVSDICAGKFEPSFDLQEKIAEYYGMPLATFIADGLDRMEKRHSWKYVKPSSASSLDRVQRLMHAVESAELRFGIDEYLKAKSDLVQFGEDTGTSEETIHAMSMAICEDFVRRVALKNGA